MKKAYIKPMLIVERFTLSQTIAHNCGDNLFVGEPAYGSKEHCGWDLGGGEIIFLDPNHCNNPGEYYDFICYNAPEGGFHVFHS